MAPDFNARYYQLMLQQVPDGARAALEVGCGDGRFARLLAGRGLEVDGFDRDAGMVEEARAAGGGPVYRQADVREEQLPRERYDFISCIASLHHMPFDTVTDLRRALAPGGALAVLGLLPARTPVDFVFALPALARLHASRFDRRPSSPQGPPMPMVWPPPLSYAQTRAEAARLLPGARVRRLLWWRYLLVYREPGRG